MAYIVLWGSIAVIEKRITMNRIDLNNKTKNLIKQRIDLSFTAWIVLRKNATS